MRSDDPGFDVAAAIRALHREAVSLGATPVEGRDSEEPYAVALGHIWLHGLQVQGPRCTASPCRIGGVCFALYEVLEYDREATGPRPQAVIGMRKAAERASLEIRKQLVLLAEASRPLRRTGIDMHRHEQEIERPGLLHDHDLTCERPLRLLARVRDLVNELACYGNELLRPIQSRQLRQPISSKPSALLLTAVYQHLHWGGVKPKEAGELVPDGVAGDPEKRIRSRMSSPDARSLVPADVLATDLTEIDPRDS